MCYDTAPSKSGYHFSFCDQRQGNILSSRKETVCVVKTEAKAMDAAKALSYEKGYGLLSGKSVDSSFNTPVGDTSPSPSHPSTVLHLLEGLCSSDTDSAVGGVHKQHLPVSHAGSKADCARPALLIALHQACSHHTTPTEGCRKCAPPSWFPGDLRVRLYLDDPACLGHHILVRSTFCHPGTP